jgi:hypothetical protein
MQTRCRRSGWRRNDDLAAQQATPFEPGESAAEVMRHQQGGHFVRMERRLDHGL